MENQEGDSGMKTLGIMLLSFEMAVHLAAKLSPIPFIGFAVALLGFPLALKLSLEDLFLIEAGSILFAWAINVDGIYFQYQWSMNTLASQAPQFLPFWTPVFFMVLIASLFAAAGISSLLMKLFARKTPERLKHIW